MFTRAHRVILKLSRSQSRVMVLYTELLSNSEYSTTGLNTAIEKRHLRTSHQQPRSCK